MKISHYNDIMSTSSFMLWLMAWCTGLLCQTCWYKINATTEGNDEDAASMLLYIKESLLTMATH